jgi:hypothetical protein
MSVAKSSIERAFEIASSGRVATLHELGRLLRREGYWSNEIASPGPLLRKQLKARILAGRPDLAAQRDAKNARRREEHRAVRDAPEILKRRNAPEDLMAQVSYRVAPAGDEWSITRDAEQGASYVSQAAAFEIAVSQASGDLRSGHAVVISIATTLTGAVDR